MPVELSKQCDALICILYREYLSRRAHGVPMNRAVAFPDDVSIRDSFLPAWPLEDVADACRKLCVKGLLSADYADGHPIDIDITDEGVIYMEGRFQRRLDRLLEYLGKLAGAIPL